MDMYFYWGTDVKFLFSAWETYDNDWLFLLCCLASLVVGIICEFLKSRQFKSLAFEASVYGVNLFLAYMLMLVMMTFNGGLFISVILGYVIGYTLFGFAPVEFKTRK